MWLLPQEGTLPSFLSNLTKLPITGRKNCATFCLSIRQLKEVKSSDVTGRSKSSLPWNNYVCRHLLRNVFHFKQRKCETHKDLRAHLETILMVPTKIKLTVGTSAKSCVKTIRCRCTQDNSRRPRTEIFFHFQTTLWLFNVRYWKK